MPELQVIARYRVAAGNEEEVFALLRRQTEATRREPGCLAFAAYRAIDDPRDVILDERYVSREAFLAHRETPHFNEIILGQVVPLLERRVFETFEVADDDGT